MNSTIQVLSPRNERDWKALEELWQSEWGGLTMITQGVTYYLRDLEALIAWENDQVVGAVTYRMNQDQAEIISINALKPKLGIGSTLLRMFEKKVLASGGIMVWLITTNDNMEALLFYQKRGYRMTMIFPGAVDEARKHKPSIPLIGDHGIPLHDEIRLEKLL